jgi:hypothetical protein
MDSMISPCFKKPAPTETAVRGGTVAFEYSRMVLLSNSYTSNKLIRCILTNDATTEKAFLVFAIFWITVILKKLKEKSFS